MSNKNGGVSSVVLRLGLGLGFLSAVADRLGFWGLLGNRMWNGEITRGSWITRTWSTDIGRPQ